MQRLQAYKFQLRTTPAQESVMRRFAGCCRFIWNKAILDQGWFEFRRQLTYKLTWRGGKLIAVPPQYTSQTCNHCGHIDKANRKTQAQFICTAWGFEVNADCNAALNILAAGHAVTVCDPEGSSEAKTSRCLKGLRESSLSR